MKFSLFLLTLLMLPIHTEAKAKSEGRFLTSLNPYVCKQVREIGSTTRGQYFLMGNGTDKDFTTVSFKLSSRDRIQMAVAAANASLSSDGRIVFCVSKKNLKVDAKEISLTEDTAFSGMINESR